MFFFPSFCGDLFQNLSMASAVSGSNSRISARKLMTISCSAHDIDGKQFKTTHNSYKIEKQGAGIGTLLQTVEKPQFCVRQNWGFEHILDKL